MRLRITAVFILLGVLALGSDRLRSGGAAAQGLVTEIQGTVVDRATGAPVAGASASLPDLGLTATTNAAGRFSWSSVGIPQTPYPTTITVRASGYGDWTIVDVRLIADDTLLLRVELGPDPVQILVPPAASDRTSTPAEQVAAAQFDSVTVDQTGLPIPRTIRVRVTGYPYCDTSRPYTVQTLDFAEYAKHVLPNEWVSSWPREALRAGAMAVKMYAWSYIAAGGKWPDADVYDSTCDQVYNPSVAYASTNRAVDFTWGWRLTRDLGLVRTFYRAHQSQCPSGLGGNCMGQYESRDMALDLYTWDEILRFFYDNSVVSAVSPPPGGWSLRFEGNGYGDLDRVKVQLDSPARPVDVGLTDFTVEWWMKAVSGENGSPACTPGGDNWVLGNTLLDRDVSGPGDFGDFGISLAGGVIAFGVHNGTVGETLCGVTPIANGAWHHVAVTRRASDGWMALYVDGALDREVDGPDGDLSYRDGRPSGLPNDPFLVIGAEKHDANPSANPSFRGWLDEIRFSTVVRYAAPYATPAGPFGDDGDTAALYHFNEGFGNTIGDAAGAAGGPSQGLRVYGGIVNGPEWTSDSPWYVAPTPTATLGAPGTTVVPTATATPTQTRTPTRTSTPTNTASATPTATATALRFAVVGDYGYEGPAALDVSNLIKSWNPQFIVTLGDNNYPDGSASTIDDNIGQYYSDFIFPYTGAYGPGASANRFFPVLGNHDWITAGAQPYLDYFTLPGNERYYDFVAGPVHFFALDSDPNEADGITQGSVQGAWLQNALAASTAPWQVVLAHHPPYSSGDHGSVGMQWPYAAWGADVVLAGHDHTYERLRVDGIPYFVNGLGGRSIYGFNNPLPETQFRYNADYGAMRVDASSSQLSLQFLDRAGALVDTLVLTPQAATSTPTATATPTRTITPTVTSTPTITLTPTPQLPGDVAPGLNFQTIASGFSQPLFVTHAGDQSDRLFVVQRGGLVRIISPSGSILSPAFLNISSLITTSGSEQGVLGMAFHPEYVNNGLFYMTYNNPSGAIVLARYRVSTTNPNLADTSWASILLTIPKPYSNHNGGMIAFGDDGMLYMSTGDGGGGGDPLGSGQSRTTLLGKILRLDVDTASPYAVPVDNPFYNDPNPAVREEIWDYGFRNPWRFSFDRSTGDLWIGDVGQGNREEIDFEPSASAGGLNYGWNVMEGTWCYSPSSGCNTSGKILPVIDYNTHDTGNCAVTGGYIYRGSRYPSLWGVYFYADYCSGKLWGLAQQTPGIWSGGLIVDTSYFVSSFGEDEAGELYLTDYAGGRVVRIQGSDPAPTPTPTVTPVFGDVPASHWAHDYIEALFNAGYIAGCSASPRLYCPLSNMARAEGAVFVVRGVHGGGFLPPDPGSQVFGDVPLSQWYARWADTLYLDGYTAGCSASPLLFCPLQAHTRAEAAVFYLRMLNGPSFIPPDPTSIIFTDVPLTAWFARWVNAAHAAGLLLPCQTAPSLRYCPDSPLTRDVGAYMMVQAKGGLPLP